MFPDLLALSTMTLATSDANGLPHAAPVYFAADQALHLYFFSDPASLHSRHLADNPRAAGAIYPECHDWRDILGLQLHGEVHSVPPGPEWDVAWELYAAKFPFVSELRIVVEKNVLYALTPVWVRLVDNRRSFGFKQEWDLP
jgi:uncharacterized protein YhbP (UPF0306 family)